MNIIFLKSNKPKVSSVIVNDSIRINIEYQKLNNWKNYKFELLGKIIGKGLSLVVLNTRYMYADQKEDYIKHNIEILLELDKFNIEYKKVTINREYKASIFGIPIRQSDNTKMYEDYIVGFVVKNEDMDNIIDILSRFNPHYFISCDTLSEEEILNIFEANSDSEDKIKSSFSYSVIDDNFLGNISIVSKKENVEFINGFLK